MEQRKYIILQLARCEIIEIILGQLSPFAKLRVAVCASRKLRTSFTFTRTEFLLSPFYDRLAYALRTPVTWNTSGRKNTAGVWVCVRGPALPRTEAGCGRD